MTSIFELPATEFHKATRLFSDLAKLHPFVTAVLKKDEPGRIFVDDLNNPQSGFMSTKEVQFLAGDPDNARFNQALKHLLRDTICKGIAPQTTIDEVDLTFLNDKWEHQLKFLFGDWRWPPIPSRGVHYLWQEGQLQWQSLLPDGYTIQPLNACKVKAQPGKEMPFAIKPFVAFGVDGFGFCALHNGRIVSSCFCDLISKPSCEIGVETDPNHRRQNLATITTAATVAYALDNGFTNIWWICDVNNMGSIKTAVKNGFKEQFQTNSYFFILDEAEHRRQVNEHKRNFSTIRS